MKASYQTLFFALLFLFSATGFASDREDLTPNGEFLSKDGFEEKLDDRASYQEDEDDQLEKLAEIPKVKAQIEGCKALKESGTAIGSIEDCVWNGVPNTNITALDQTTKDEIYAKLKVAEDDNSEKGSEYEGVGLSNINQKRSKSLKALEKFYGNMFKEAIGEDTTDGKGGDDSSKNTFVNVDQKKFHDIQQSHISKTIIDSISQFCVDAKSIQEGNKTRVVISADAGDRKNQRDANIAMLAQPNGGPGQNQHWTRCTAALQLVCKNPSSYYGDLSTTNQPSDADQTETQNRACITVTYLKGKRQELVRVEEIQEQWKTHFNTNKKLGRYEIKNFKYAKKVDTENIVNVTSGQIANSEELKEAKKEEVALLEKCKQDYQGNKEACDEYLVGQEDSEKLEEEFAIRNKAATEKLKDTVKDKETLEKYLKEQNYTEEQIAKMTKDDTTIQKSIANITQSYENQREALVKKMREKLANSTRRKDQQGKETPGDFGKLKAELEQNHDDWVQVTHFSNVVSGYLTFKDSNNQNGQANSGGANGASAGKNTRALTRELGNSAYASDRGPASGNTPDDYFDNLQNNNKVEETESNDDGTTKNTLIDSKTLNESILNESGEKLN